MKQIYKKMLMLITIICASLSASAYDFEVDGIYYNVLSLSDLTCEVTYDYKNYSTSKLIFVGAWITEPLTTSYPSYEGDVCIPQKVTYKNREFTVTSIGQYAFLNCTSLTSLTLPPTISNIEQVFIQERYGEYYYAGAFDYCNIETFSAGNPYTLQMFNQSTSKTSRTKDNLRTLILSKDFNGTIDVDFSSYNKLTKIECRTQNPPNISSSTFSNSQYIGMLVKVPREVLNSYKSSPNWSSFWNIVSIEDEVTTPSEISNKFSHDGITYSVPNYQENLCEVVGVDHGGIVIIPEKVFYLDREVEVKTVSYLTSEQINHLVIPKSIDSFSASIKTNGEISINNSIVLPYIVSLQRLTLLRDFYGDITCKFNKFPNLKVIESFPKTPPVCSYSSIFTDSQYLNMEVLVPEDSYPSYQSADVWKDFWELKPMKSVRTLALNETSLNLEPKQAVQLSVAVSPEDAYDSSVTWTSSNPLVATVTEEGLVTAITKGDAQIVVTANDGSGVQAECSVHVDLLVKDIQLSDAQIGLEPGNSKHLNVIISPKDAFVQDVLWSSDDEKIATVDNQGNVTTHSVGVTNINASTTDGSNLTATCKVTVANLVKSIIVTPENLTIKEGETGQLYATVTPENATYQEVIWSSENLDIASVDASGKVTAVSSGTTLIKATATDGSGVYGQCELTVTAETVVYNGICYQRNSLTTLKIVQNSEYPYSGDFFIPETAQFNGSEMTVTEIGDGAFTNCGELTSIVIPNTIAKIRESAFDGCDKLKFVKICDGSSMEANLDVVFSDSPISELYIGANAVTYNPDSRLLSLVKSIIAVR